MSVTTSLTPAVSTATAARGRRASASSTAPATPPSPRSTTSASASARASSPRSWGPSGSGKSTLLHMLAGLDRPTSGEVYLGDTEITSLNDKALTLLRRDRIGFIFQSFNLLPTMTAAENIVLPMRIAGTQAGRRTGSRSIVETVGLTGRLEHRPSELSGGQQQRVAAARALASRPQIVFADEPTGALDSRSGAELLGFLRNAVDELGQTVVMVTHDPTAASYADRVLFLADGHIVDEMHAPDRRRRPRLHEAPGSLTMLTATVRSDARAQAAPRPHHGVDRTRRRVPGRHARSSPTPWGSPSTSSSARSPPAPTRSSAPRPPTPQSEGVGTSRGPIAASVLDQVRSVDGVRAAEGSVSGYALLTDNDGQAILTNGGAPTMGYSMPADEELRGDVELLIGHAPRTAARGRHRRHQRRGARHRARLAPSRSCSRARPGSSPWSAPSASAARRTSAAPRRRTSTPPPPSRCSARPASSTRSTSAPSDGVSQAELAEAARRRRPRGRRGGHRRDRGARRTPTRSRRTSRSSASCSGSSPASRCSSAPSSSGTPSR